MHGPFLGRVPLRRLGQFDVPVDCGYWKRKMDEAAKEIAFSQQSIQRRANSPYREDLVNDPYTQMKFEEARKKYDDAYRMYNACLKYDKAYWEGTPIQQPVTPPPVETGAPQGMDYQYPPPPPPVASEDVRPMVPSVDTRMQPDWLRVPTDVVGPEEQPSTEPQFDQEAPGSEQAQGLPCPEGQHRPPEGGWCVPDAPPVATGYSPANALQRFGGYGGIINMAPAAATPFTMGHRKEEDMINGPFLGQIPIAPEAQCPPGKELYNVGGSLLCVEKGKFPPATYSGARPIGAFGGFGMAPSAPFGTAGMGPSSVPVTLGGRAMLGQVRLVRRPY
jgi:hypothetical protein